ncbi:MAG TPA: heparin lyase I family protein [Pilimelia sp.]|nr:heparin lyase I family protein [Pilimelia sp.]
MRRHIGWAAALTGFFGVLLSAGPARADVIFDADTSPASAAETFGRTSSGNCDTGTISTVSDPTFGRVWRFHKPKGSDRCEARGVRVRGELFEFSNNATYYIGWRFNLSNTADNNAVFQWRSNGDGLQGFPFVLKMIDGRLTMLQRQPEKREFFPWSRPIKAGTWNHVALGIHTSDSLTGGWIEVYFNGVPQRFTNGSTRWPARTWDDSNDPKWGVFGASDTEVTNLIDALRVGTSLADVRAPAPPPAAKPAKVRPAPTASGTPPPSPSATPGAPPIVALADDGPGGPGRTEATGTDGGGSPDATTLLVLALVAGLISLAAYAASRTIHRRRPRHGLARRMSSRMSRRVSRRISRRVWWPAPAGRRSRAS